MNRQNSRVVLRAGRGAAVAETEANAIPDVDGAGLHWGRGEYAQSLRALCCFIRPQAS
jgi:hypothetical protein